MPTSTESIPSRPPLEADAGDYAALAPLFCEFANSDGRRRRELRSRLVTGHLPLAEHIARRFRNRGQPSEDLMQVANLGLINAVDRFDPDRGTNFLAFAVPTITGELRRYFRDATWAVRVPRRIKELHASVNAASGALSQRLGRAPRPSELADELDLPIGDVYEGLQAGFAYRCDSLDEPDGDGDPTSRAEGHIGVLDEELAAVEDREALSPALAKLPEREAAIIAMRFFGNMTQSQIAQRVGVSQMHVSRLLAGALRTLRAELSAD
jgi:RNA polymerase sigma-B factor